MADTGTGALSPAQRALYELRAARARVQELERAARAPIAIVGAGLRFPGGAVDVDSWWRLLDGGVDAIAPVPADRWDIERYFDADPDTPGSMYTREGGFLGDVDRFDAEFFGISPREAESMDPQQRLLLEVAWEALEHAGQDPHRLLGTATGVFLGLSNSDYGRRTLADMPSIDTYTTTGGTFSVAAGRLSFILGLTGPSMVVDTACSASLVALHLACRSLRAGECSMALAGGVNLILSPEVTINFCRARMLAPDCRCKTFDAAADGYVRGEGCAMVVLKRLDDALAAGDHVMAVIRGSAINQDGRSSGLTVPSGPAQEAVIRAALADARVEPSAIDYVEAHGTGTSLGDPIEAHALAAVLGAGRAPERPLLVGSVKTNVGHLEAAAGIAGLLKVVLALQRERIPAHLHFSKLNPHINWAGVPIEVPAAGRPWPRGERPRVAGVSSFGFSGTNAHVILEEPPLPSAPAATVPERAAHVLVASARTPAALDALVARHAEHVASAPADAIRDICHTANTGRAHFAERAVFVAETRDELAAQLAARTPFTRGRADRPAEVAFVFTGQGAQYPGMGRELYETEPAFRRAIDLCHDCLAGELRPGIRDVLYGDATGLLDDTRYTQPTLYALQYALGELWRSWGVTPSFVLGHSVGEYAAGCVAGLYSPEDGLGLIAARGRLSGDLAPGDGLMLVILAPEDEVRAAVEEVPDQVGIAAWNGPENVVISGHRPAVEAIAARFAARGIRTEPLRVSHAFHSPMMEPIADEFARAAEKVRFEEPRAGIVSSVLGRVASRADMATPAYWRRQLRHSVRFHEAMQVLEKQGATLFVEIGPGSTVLGMGRQSIGKDGQLWTPSIRRARPDVMQMAESLADLYVRGVPVDWALYEGGRGRRRVALPTYPFERRRFWVDAAAPAAVPSADPAASWRAVTEAAEHQAGHVPVGLDLASYGARWACLERLTGAFIRSTLRGIGAFGAAGERHTVASLVEKCGISGTFTHLVGRWLARLARDGALRPDGDAFESVAPLDVPDLPAMVADAERLFGDDRVFLDYATACGSLLPGILTGQVNALETVFPGGSFDRAEAIYEHAPVSRYIAGIARAALEGMVRMRRRGLRVLELGAGTGGTTAALLPVLAGSGSEYWFTDISDVFLLHAEEKFRAYPFVRYARHDIEDATGVAPFAPASFDVVVATNVLHEAHDLERALRGVRSLLAPDGQLVLCEVTTYLPWYDITTALIEARQPFAEAWRTDHPLAGVADWSTALAAAGFDRVLALPAAGSASEVLGQHVLIAAVPGLASDAVPRGADGETAAALPTAAAVADPGAQFLERLAEAAESERLDLLVDVVRTAIAGVLRTAPGALDRQRRLMDLGLDSLMALELRGRLAKFLHLGRPLPSTLVFDHPTMESIARYLEGDVLGFTRVVEDEPARPTAIETRAREVERLSDEEAEAQLIEQLKSLRTER